PVRIYFAVVLEMSKARAESREINHRRILLSNTRLEFRAETSNPARVSRKPVRPAVRLKMPPTDHFRLPAAIHILKARNVQVPASSAVVVSHRPSLQPWKPTLNKTRLDAVHQKVAEHP